MLSALETLFLKFQSKLCESLREDALKLSNNQVPENVMSFADIERAKLALEKAGEKYRSHDGSRLKAIEKQEIDAKLELKRLERNIKAREEDAERVGKLFVSRRGR